VLRGSQLLWYKFRRQYSIGSYVVDFYCPAVKLAIELDGESHNRRGARRSDRSRDAFIESFGIRVVRILNTEVYENLEGVWDGIARIVRERAEEVQKPGTVRCNPPVSPLHKGGGDDMERQHSCGK